MKPEYKAKWIEALRSGTYQQARAALRVDGSFCCLGVLCDIVRGDLDAWWDVHEGVFWVGDSSYANSLPDPVSELVGGVTKEGTLIRMNDGGNSFAEIADHIEKWL